MGKGTGHSEPSPAQVQDINLVPLICKYSLTLADSNGGCGRNTAERHLFSDAVPEDITVCSVAQVMCQMTGEEELDMWARSMLVLFSHGGSQVCFLQYSRRMILWVFPACRLLLLDRLKAAFQFPFSIDSFYQHGVSHAHSQGPSPHTCF